MKKQINLFLLVFLTGTLFAQDNLFSQAKVLFDEGQYSACQSVLNQLSETHNTTAEFMYLYAKCS